MRSRKLVVHRFFFLTQPLTSSAWKFQRATADGAFATPATTTSADVTLLDEESFQYFRTYGTDEWT
jgi:hypothetical protein